VNLSIRIGFLLGMNQSITSQHNEIQFGHDGRQVRRKDRPV
jgi:hypothetical protein